ncbi:MAG: V-type ATPase subunit [Spirochaetales bacterium]|nr:V-type ATPase subunit [Spirochaetales bacterium]
MKSPVSRYGFINAKLRARISMILTEEFSSSLLRSASMEEVLQLLKETEFSPVSDAYDRTGDIQSAELELFQMQIGWYREIVKITEDVVQGFIRSMSLKLEIENLKNAIRLWYGSRIKKRPIGHRAGYLYRERILNNIDWDGIINAVSFDEIITSLNTDIYTKAIEPFRTAMETGDGLFKMEIALDRMYYDFLFSSAKELPSKDRALVERILTTEIEIQNINWLIRYSHFYSVTAPELEEILIPRGMKISVEDIQSYLSQETRQKDPAALLKGKFPALASLSIGDKGSAASQAILFEQLLEATRKEEFMKLISGYPFTIGIVLVYFFMKNRESRFLMSVLNGKYYGWKSERIREVTG